MTMTMTTITILVITTTTAIIIITIVIIIIIMLIIEQFSIEYHKTKAKPVQLFTKWVSNYRYPVMESSNGYL